MSNRATRDESDIHPLHPQALVFLFVLERQIHPRAESGDFAVYNHQVEFVHFRDAQVAQRFCCSVAQRSSDSPRPANSSAKKSRDFQFVRMQKFYRISEFHAIISYKLRSAHNENNEKKKGKI